MAGECLGSLKWLGILSPRHGQIHLMFSLVKRKLKDCNSDGRFWTLPVFINDVSFQIVFFLGKIYISLLCIWVFVCIYVYVLPARLVPTEARRGHRFPWDWSYRWLWTAQCWLWDLTSEPYLQPPQKPFLKSHILNNVIHYTTLTWYLYAEELTVERHLGFCN